MKTVLTLVSCLTLFAAPVAASDLNLRDLIESSTAQGFVFSAPETRAMRQLERTLSRLESQHQLPNNRISQLAYSLAVLHLQTGNFQEALWALNRGGFESESNHLIHMLTSIMVQESRTAVERPGDSIFGVRFDGSRMPGVRRVGGGIVRELRQNISVVNKFSDLQWSNSVRYEVFAYELDALLNLNRVPLTVEATHEGGLAFSMQLYINNSRDSGLNYRDLQYSDQLDRREILGEVLLFDYLLGSADRSEQNSLITESDRVALIDNGRSFSNTIYARDKTNETQKVEFEQVLRNYLENNRFPPRLLSKLELLTSEFLHRKFDRLIGAENVDVLISRKDLVLSLSRSAPSTQLRRNGRATAFQCHRAFAG